MARHDAAFIRGNPEPHYESTGQVGMRDSLVVKAGDRRELPVSWLLGALAAGGAAGLAVSASIGQAAVLPTIGAVAFIGGLLSTWSPCGYSSLSLLRPAEPYTARAVIAWLPTLGAHALGYLAGGLVLGAALGLVAWPLPGAAHSKWALAGLGVVAIGFALHQLGLISMPYPQRRVQVPHQARLQLPMWQTGLLYGWQLGLNFVTYVRTPIVYLVVLAAVLSGSIASAIVLVLILNFGRFLPMLLNLLPLHDWTVQRWLANNEPAAIKTDALTLAFCGTVLLTVTLNS